MFLVLVHSKVSSTKTHKLFKDLTCNEPKIRSHTYLQQYKIISNYFSSSKDLVIIGGDNREPTLYL